MSTLRTQLTAGHPVFGTFCASSDPVTAERMSAAGWDFIVVDLQHGLATNDSLVPVLMAVELGGAAALVRVPRNEPAAIGRALDYGAQGVVVPMVSTAEEAAAAVQACRYPPLGERSFGQMRGNRYGGLDGANSALLCIVMIETGDGVANLEAILNTPGVDGAFVGPHDLTLGLGLAFGLLTADPNFNEAMNRILDTCQRTGRTAGGFFFSNDDAANAVATGWRLIAVMPDSDIAALRGLPLAESS